MTVILRCAHGFEREINIPVSIDYSTQILFLSHDGITYKYWRTNDDGTRVYNDRRRT